MRTQTKIAAIFFLFSLFVIILFSVSVYYPMNKFAFSDFYKRLEIRAVIAARSALETEADKASVMREIRALHLQKLPQEKEYIFKITPGRSFAEEAERLKVPVSFFQSIKNNRPAIYQQRNIFFSGISYQAGPDRYAVIVSAENYFNIHYLAYIRNVILAAIIISSLFALSMSVLFSRQVFNPVIAITRKVKEIGSQNLHVRLDGANEKDEVGELAATFNNMLDRLETAFETQNNFISNASHELSTPLTTIIGEADVTLSKVRPPDEYIRALSVILHEAERLDSITRSLLFLAQTGFNGKTQKFERMRADQLVYDAKETIDKINPDNKISIDLSRIPHNPDELKIKANGQLLHLAITNVMTNACKYSNNGPVTVSLYPTEASVIIAIQDHGIGIPGNELQHIYDPFFRASNTGEYAGYGIGLPLSRNIMRIHRGEIVVLSRQNEGTLVQLIFPHWQP
ncbi:HAMP domain-containing sensor histidine kinase [Nemorincola caseinilytica]|uniref:histidine kinase n=1 Tax=Nemorincola caseinilytica TaxID=2054315 RepID=A0ABP8NBC7_9BACT